MLCIFDKVPKDIVEIVIVFSKCIESYHKLVQILPKLNNDIAHERILSKITYKYNNDLYSCQFLEPYSIRPDGECIWFTLKARGTLLPWIVNTYTRCFLANRKSIWLPYRISFGDLDHVYEFKYHGKEIYIMLNGYKIVNGLHYFYF